MRKIGTKALRIEPFEELTGRTIALVYKYDLETFVAVSPAVYSLLHDDSVKDQVLKDLEYVDVREVMKQEYQALIDRINSRPKKTRKRKNNE